jgi:hypothetical protein
MKCELCHNAEAETAIVRLEGGEEAELYVCSACAKAEKLKRQKKSQRTRKAGEIPPGMSITVAGNMGEVPPFIGSILDAVHGMVSDLEKAETAKGERRRKSRRIEFCLKGVDAHCMLAGALHLEGLHLIGELDAAKRAAKALEMELAGTDADGVRCTGHVFKVMHSGNAERAGRFVADLVKQERNARARLFGDMSRVFGDALCRALAILKNCRLLAPGELFDLLSPLRLAALEKMLDGIKLAQIENLIAGIDLSGAEDRLAQDERDRIDAERADEMNARFEDVVLNELAEETFL